MSRRYNIICWNMEWYLNWNIKTLWWQCNRWWTIYIASLAKCKVVSKILGFEARRDSHVRTELMEGILTTMGRSHMNLMLMTFMLWCTRHEHYKHTNIWPLVVMFGRRKFEKKGGHGNVYSTPFSIPILSLNILLHRVTP